MAGFDRALLIGALLLTVVLLAYFWTPTDPDVWWHLQNGRLVWTLGRVPQGDLYSYTVPGARWIMQQWLLEAVMYAIEQTLGYAANVLLFGLITVSVYLLLFRLMRAAGAGRPLAVGVMGMALILDAPTWGVRPQVVTTLFCVIFLAVLLRYHCVGADRRLWLLPPLMLVWANVHAGFTVGLLLLGAAVVGEAINRILGRPSAPLRPLLLVTAACAGLSLLNPNGLDLWLYPLTYLSGPGGNPSLHYVQEWQPPDFRTLQSLPLLASLLALLVLGSVRRPAARSPSSSTAGGKRSPPSFRGKGSGELRLRAGGNAAFLLMLGGFTLMALQAGRFLPLYGMVWAVAVAGRLLQLWPRLGNFLSPPSPALGEGWRERSAPAWMGRLNVGVYFGFSLLLAGVMLTNGRAQVHSAPLERDYPAAAVTYLDAHRTDLPQPLHLFHEYGWGGYLIARGRPVFIDGRADPYNSIFDRYIAATAGHDWRSLFARYGVNAVLIRPHAPLDTILSAAAGWQRVYGDRQAVLYVAR